MAVQFSQCPQPLWMCNKNKGDKWKQKGIQKMDEGDKRELHQLGLSSAVRNTDHLWQQYLSEQVNVNEQIHANPNISVSRRLVGTCACPTRNPQQKGVLVLCLTGYLLEQNSCNQRDDR